MGVSDLRDQNSQSMLVLSLRPVPAVYVTRTPRGVEVQVPRPGRFWDETAPSGSGVTANFLKANF